jgi:quercetin dioxygenase-like cupin family protein
MTAETIQAIAWGGGRMIDGTPFRVAVPTTATDGHAVVLTVDMPPGLRVDAHTHEDEVQINVVLSGRVGCRVGDTEYVLEAGGLIAMPRGVEHELWNAGDEFARVMEIYTPPGIEERFATAGAAALARGADIADGADYGNRPR